MSSDTHIHPHAAILPAAAAPPLLAQRLGQFAQRLGRLAQRSRWLVTCLLALVVAAPALAQPEVIRLSAIAAKSTVRPNDQLAIAIIFDHDDGWHSHTNKPIIPESWGDFEAIPTRIVIAENPAIQTGTIQWPKSHAIPIDLAATGTPVPYEVFEGRAIAYIPVIVNGTAPEGTASLSITVSFQACDDSTCMRERTVTLPVTLTVAPTALPTTQPATQTPPQTPPQATTDPALFATFDQSTFAKMLAGVRDVERVEFNFFGRSFSLNPQGLGLVLLLLVAVLGGALLNMTPCVLPVIPIKIMSLSAAAGNPTRCLFLGFIMFLGVVAFWLVLGGAIAFISGFNAISQLFQIPWFSIGVGLFIAAMGIGMMGIFTINLPQFIYMLDPKRESAAGSFFFGIMTAVLSTPCTAPFMGTAAAWAAKQPAIVTMATFAAIGVGMALPYLLLAANPKWVAKVPRTGPASNVVKQVMGMLMLAVAVFFIGTGIDPLLRNPVDPPMRFYWWIVAAIVVFAAVWCVVRAFQLPARRIARATLTIIAGFIAVGSIAGAARLTDRGPIRWVGYTPDRFAQAMADGKVAVLDFTAEWCLTCKALENGVLHREAVYTRLNAEDVVAFRVDLTGDNPAGQAKLSELNWVGLPLLAVYGPGTTEPAKYDTYTQQTVLDAIQAAAAKP